MKINKFILGLTSLIIIALTTTIILLAMNDNNKVLKNDNSSKEILFGKNLNLKSDSPAIKDGIKAENIVIKNKEQLDALNTKFGNQNIKTSLEKVNLNENLILAILAGEKPSGGYDIKIEKIIENDQEIEVKIIETIPANDCITTSVLTSPYQIVDMQKSDKTIRFSKDIKITSCNEN